MSTYHMPGIVQGSCFSVVSGVILSQNSKVGKKGRKEGRKVRRKIRKKLSKK